MQMIPRTETALIKSVTDAADLDQESQEILASIVESLIPILRDRAHFQHENAKHQRLYFETADRLNAALNRLANRDFEVARQTDHINALEEKVREILGDLAQFQSSSRISSLKAEEILARHANPIVAIHAGGATPTTNQYPLRGGGGGS